MRDAALRAKNRERFAAIDRRKALQRESLARAIQIEALLCLEDPISQPRSPLGRSEDRASRHRSHLTIFRDFSSLARVSRSRDGSLLEIEAESILAPRPPDLSISRDRETRRPGGTFREEPDLVACDSPRRVNI